MRGVVYEMKMLTWVAWKLMRQDDRRIGKWWLATEVSKARGFHDLVLKYIPNDSKGSSDVKYRFMQMKHKTSLEKYSDINDSYLISKNKLHRQGSLIYLFKSYVNMLNSFENIKPDQILDLTIFTNMNIKAFRFLIPRGNDKLYGFEEKGKRYRIDINEIRKTPGIIPALMNINPDENIIFGFLKKLIFAVSQPSEHELEKFIIKDMETVYNVPQIFYNSLYKNIIDWFLIYTNGKAPFLTKTHVEKYLKDTEIILEQIMETCVDSPSKQAAKLPDKLKLLSL